MNLKLGGGCMWSNSGNLELSTMSAFAWRHRKTKINSTLLLLHSKTQSVPRSKHYPSRL